MLGVPTWAQVTARTNTVSYKDSRVYLGPARALPPGCLYQDYAGNRWALVDGEWIASGPVEFQAILGDRIPFVNWCINRKWAVRQDLLEDEFAFYEWEQGTGWADVSVEELSLGAYTYLQRVADKFGCDPVDFSAYWAPVLEEWICEGAVECGVWVLLKAMPCLKTLCLEDV